MPKITLDQLKQRIIGRELSEADILRLVRGDPLRASSFEPGLALNDAEVEGTVPADGGGFSGSSLFRWANALEREGRRRRFEERADPRPTKPVILSEGDSWFQFPLLLRDVIDQLDDDFLAYSLDAAGDTLENRVFTAPEYLVELGKLTARFPVFALVFSGSGNDVLGNDNDGRSVLERIIRPFDPGRPDPGDAPFYIAEREFEVQLGKVRNAHIKIFESVQADFPKVKVLCHSYAYAIPGGFTHDSRDPIYADRDQWLGAPFEALGFPKNSSQPLREAIVRVMIDRLTEAQQALCGGSHAGGRFANAIHVDVRTVVPRDEWNDEIHPTNAGFRKVAAVFEARLRALAADA